MSILVRPTKPATLPLAAKDYADLPDPDGSDNGATETATVTR